MMVASHSSPAQGVNPIVSVLFLGRSKLTRLGSAATGRALEYSREGEVGLPVWLAPSGLDDGFLHQMGAITERR